MTEGADDSLFPSSVGEQLAAERVRQNLELSDIAARTRIPLRHLEAIETGRYDGLPALPYSAGFVKSYAAMLGLDGQTMSRAFRAQIGDKYRGHFEPEAYEPVDPTRVPTRLLAMVALGVALLLGMAYLLLRFERDSSDLARLVADTVQDSRPVPARPSPPPPPPPAAEPTIPTGPISIAATADVWIKISERDGGSTYFMDVLAAGQSFTVPESGVDPILRTGLPQGLKVMIGSTELPPIGPPDQLVRDYSLRRDALVAIASGGAGPVSGPADNAPPAAGAVPVAVDRADGRPVPARVAQDPGQAP